jgi:arylsulfatase A-like enzyme
MKTFSSLLLTCFVSLGFSFPEKGQPNVVIMFLDDVGIDRIGAYAAHPDPGRTPNIDAFAAEGLKFVRAYSNPSCTPTRAAAITGRYGLRTGILRAINLSGAGLELPLSETTIAEALPGTYWKAALGKWHLSHDPNGPNLQGFDYYAGSLYNLNWQGDPTLGYFNWQKTTNGSTQIETKYATKDTKREALAALDGIPEPFFLWIGWNAAHSPTHAPPPGMHTYDEDPGLSPLNGGTIPLYTRAMAEALDDAIGEVLAAIPENTFVFIMGDNGTDDLATDAPFLPDHAKGTVYQGGINVPSTRS